jgi:hypothetical protein
MRIADNKMFLAFLVLEGWTGLRQLTFFVLIVVKKLQTFLNAWMFGSQTGIRQNIM